MVVTPFSAKNSTGKPYADISNITRSTFLKEQFFCKQ